VQFLVALFLLGYRCTNCNYCRRDPVVSYHEPQTALLDGVIRDRAGFGRTSHVREAMNKHAMRILLLILIASPLTGEAARPLGPPIAEFFNDRNRIVTAVATVKSSDNKIVMRIVDYLYLEDDNQTTIVVDVNVFADVEIGTEYVIVFSRLRKNRLLRDEWEVNPDGPTLVKTRGLDTPAIYTSNAAIATLLTPHRRDALSADAETSMLLSIADDDGDFRARELAIFELYLRPDLQNAMSADNARRYAAVTSDADARLKNFLLEGAKNFPEKRRSPWLEREFRGVIAAHGNVLDLNSDIPLLVKNSLLGLRDGGTEQDLDMIARHLYSNAPGVARAALAAMNDIDPRQAFALAQKALETDDIHEVTRRELTRYVNERTGA